jgi:hypothetical protein
MMEVLRRDKWLRRSLVALAVVTFVWFLVAHTTVVDAYTLNSAPANLGQIHAWCSSVIGQAYSSAGVGQSASACSQQNTWWAVASWLELAMIVAVVVTGYRIYRYNFPKRRRQPTQEYWPR